MDRTRIGGEHTAVKTICTHVGRQARGMAFECFRSSDHDSRKRVNVDHFGSHYIEDITRGREDINFIFEWQNNILRTSAASELNIVFATRK